MPLSSATTLKEEPASEYFDLDRRDIDNPRFCSCYALELFHFFKKQEMQHRIDSNYLAKQKNLITAQIRGELISTLVILTKYLYNVLS